MKTTGRPKRPQPPKSFILKELRQVTPYYLLGFPLKILLATLFNTAVFAQDMDVAVYVDADLPINERNIFGTYLLIALINSGQCASSENSNQFLTEIYGEHIKRDSVVIDSVACEIGKRLGIKYVCVASITPAFDFFWATASRCGASSSVRGGGRYAASPLFLELRKAYSPSFFGNPVVHNVYLSGNKETAQ